MRCIGMHNAFPKIFIVTFICCLFSSGDICHAQIGNVIGKRHAYKNKRVKKSTKAERELQTKALTLEITKGARTQHEKAEAIFNWISKNIAYDNELRVNKKLQKEIYTSEENVIKNALKRRKALCGGYAFLFQKMCNDVGIKASVVHGFTSTPGQRNRKSTQPEHTWNAVFLNGKWQPLDITWAVSHGAPNNPKTFWFLTNPSDFNRTHVPMDRKWLLQNRT